MGGERAARWRLFPRGVFRRFADTTTMGVVCGKNRHAGGEGGRPRKLSTGIREGGHEASQAQLENEEQVDRGAHGVGAAMEVTHPVEPFDGQGQADQQPDHQQAFTLMVADVLEAIAVFGVIEPLVLDFPAALGHEKDGAAADPVRGKVGEPVSLVDLTVGLVLSVADHAHGFPPQCFPGVKVIGIPDFHSILAMGKHRVGERLSIVPACQRKRLSFKQRALVGGPS